MADWSASNSAQRANQVWERLLGCFGAPLISKFGEEPPQEWVAALTMLNDYQLAQGMRRLVYSGKTHPPTLPEFVKLCRTVGHADDVPDQRSRLPTSRALAGPDDQFDGWDIASNFRLLGYILRKGVDRVPLDPEQTRALVAFKYRWADLMRESGSREEVPLSDQDSAWIQGMRTTEAQMLRAKPA